MSKPKINFRQPNVDDCDLANTLHWECVTWGRDRLEMALAMALNDHLGLGQTIANQRTALAQLQKVGVTKSDKRLAKAAGAKVEATDLLAEIRAKRKTL